MLKNKVATVTLICFIFHLYGCSSTIEVTNDQTELFKDKEIKSIVDIDGKVYEFVSSKWHSPAQLIDSLVVGWIKESAENGSGDFKKLIIPLSEVQKLYVLQVDESGTCLAGTILGGAILIGYLIFKVNGALD